MNFTNCRAQHVMRSHEGYLSEAEAKVHWQDLGGNYTATAAAQFGEEEEGYTLFEWVRIINFEMSCQK